MKRRRDSRAGAPQWRQRYDRGELLAPVRRADGTLLVQGFACREGVLEYTGDDGRPWREYVPLSTLDASAGGLARLAVTLEHPDQDVTPENVGDLGVGDTGNVVRLEEGGFVRVDLAVRRADAITAVERGKQELSPGYLARVENTPGVHPVYGPYDAIQVERRYNHLAIVDVARGGPEIRIRADGARVSRTVIRRDTRDPVPPTPAPRPRMNPGFNALFLLLGLSQRCDSDDAAIAAIDFALRQRKDASDKAETDRKAALDKLTSDLAAEKKRADDAAAELAKVVKAKKDAEEEEMMKELDALASRLKVDKNKDVGAYKSAIASAYMGAKVADSEVDGVLAVARKAAKDAEGEEQAPPPEDDEETMEGESAPKADSLGAARRRGRAAWDANMPRDDRADRRSRSRDDADDEPFSSSSLYQQHSRRAFERRTDGGE